MIRFDEASFRNVWPMPIYDDLVALHENFDTLEEAVVERIKAFLMEKTVDPAKRSETTLRLFQPYRVFRDSIVVDVTVCRGDWEGVMKMVVTDGDDLHVF